MVRAARVGARLFAARNECLEKVEDDCDYKEYERHGVPSEAGVFPVFDVMSARLMSQKRPATPKKRILMILLFSGGGHRDNAAAEDHLLRGAGISRPSIFGRAKTSTMPIPCRIGKANTSVRAEIGGAEHSQYYYAPASGNGIRNRKDIGARPCFSALFARLILTKSYRYGIFSLCGALCAACFRCHLRGEEG